MIAKINCRFEFSKRDQTIDINAKQAVPLLLAVHCFIRTIAGLFLALLCTESFRSGWFRFDFCHNKENFSSKI